MSASQYHFYHRLQLAAHLLNKAADREVSEVAGISTAQSGVLLVVDSQSQMSQKDVALKLGFNESAIAAMVNRLIQDGYLERIQSPTDRRAKLLSLTHAGKEVLEKTKEPFCRINKLVDSLIPGADMDIVVSRLNSLIRMLKERNADIS